MSGHRKWAVLSVGIVAGMTGLSFAAVPMYRAFCQQFGFAGTPRIDATASIPTVIADREMTVRFNGDTANGLAWNFKPAQVSMTVRPGEINLAYFEAVNMADREIVGTATFNVTPLLAAKYFVKTECFCFTEQRLAAGESASMPVSFYVDPGIIDDPSLDQLRTLTLSYTFFETSASQQTAALN